MGGGAPPARLGGSGRWSVNCELSVFRVNCDLLQIDTSMISNLYAKVHLKPANITDTAAIAIHP